MGDLEDPPDGIASKIINDACTENPYRGATCIKVTYPQGFGTQRWVGIYWQFPDSNWGKQPAYDLSAYTGNGKEEVRLTFFARGALGGERGEFKVADQCARRFVRSRNHGRCHTHQTMAAVHYPLDRPQPEERGRRLLLGDQPAQNPQGCGFYLDDIRFEFGPAGTAARLSQPRFIRSYVPQKTGA